MKRTWLLALLLLLGSVGTAVAQTPVTELETLTVDLWPDYDRPAMLVLLTGTLPADAPLPAEVTVPVPEGADLNAVARISDANVMTDDVEYTEGDGRVTFVTPDRRFRIEYYVPYDVEGTQHAYTFSWLAGLTVNELITFVQEPAAATNLVIDPDPISVAADRGDGLNYHTLPPQTVPAGQPYTVTVRYTMTEPQLSTALLPDAPPAAETAVVDNNLLTNWPLWLAVVGLVLAGVGLAWQFSTRRKTSRPRKPAPRRANRVPAAETDTPRFCHNCGQAAEPGDRFCRSCGTQLKTG